jgi:hypothetical protein
VRVSVRSCTDRLASHRNGTHTLVGSAPCQKAGHLDPTGADARCKQIPPGMRRCMCARLAGIPSRWCGAET